MSLAYSARDPRARLGLVPYPMFLLYLRALPVHEGSQRCAPASLLVLLYFIGLQNSPAPLLLRICTRPHDFGRAIGIPLGQFQSRRMRTSFECLFHLILRVTWKRPERHARIEAARWPFLCLSMVALRHLLGTLCSIDPVSSRAMATIPGKTKDSERGHQRRTPSCWFSVPQPPAPLEPGWQMGSTRQF